MYKPLFNCTHVCPALEVDHDPSFVRGQFNHSKRTLHTHQSHCGYRRRVVQWRHLLLRFAKSGIIRDSMWTSPNLLHLTNQNPFPSQSQAELPRHQRMPKEHRLREVLRSDHRDLLWAPRDLRRQHQLPSTTMVCSPSLRHRPLRERVPPHHFDPTISRHSLNSLRPSVSARLH